LDRPEGTGLADPTTRLPGLGCDFRPEVLGLDPDTDLADLLMMRSDGFANISERDIAWLWALIFRSFSTRLNSTCYGNYCQSGLYPTFQPLDYVLARWPTGKYERRRKRFWGIRHWLYGMLCRQWGYLLIYALLSRWLDGRRRI